MVDSCLTMTHENYFENVTIQGDKDLKQERAGVADESAPPSLDSRFVVFKVCFSSQQHQHCGVQLPVKNLCVISQA